jgi:AcrR family transcriptional regulator
MRGRKPLRPLAEVADAAVAVFTDKGFRSAGISDVSAALGLSHGALYTYVDSKQALLYLALVRAIRPDAVGTLALPVSAPPENEMVGLVQGWLAEQTAALGVEDDRDPPVRPWADLDLGSVIDIQYRFVEQHRRVLQLIERCAADLPQLTQWWFVQRRRATLQQLGEYLQQRIGSGELPPVPDVPAAARFIVETIAWFAMHRHRDPDSGMLDDDACRRTVRHLLLAAFLPAVSDEL